MNLNVKFCPECGEELKNNPKFCPNCGYKLFQEPENRGKNLSEPTAVTGKVIYCSICGEENPADAYECQSCGAALRKGKKPLQERISKADKKQKAFDKRELKSPTPVKADHLDRTKIIYVSLGIVVILFMVVYTSGIFDTVPTVVPNQNVQQEGSSGVNLNNVQKINELEAQVKKNPSDTKLLLELAHLRNDSGLLDQAILDYKKYLQTNPGDADARIDMGVCYYKQKQYDLAIAEMKEALKYSPDHQIGHLNLGIVNLAAGNIEESKKWLTRAVEINPGTEIGKRAQELLQSH